MKRLPGASSELPIMRQAYRSSFIYDRPMCYPCLYTIQFSGDFWLTVPKESGILRIDL